MLGFVSFTEVPAGHHRAYNEWHLFDHLPEQLTIPGIAHGQRWVLTPSLRSSMVAEPPLDRIHYVTLYVMHDVDAPDLVLEAFFGLAKQLRSEGRFIEHRTSHLSGPMEVRFQSAPAAPFWPNRGVHVRLADGPIDPQPFLAVPGVSGAWTLEGLGRHAMWCWLDRAPVDVALPPPPPAAEFAATLETIDPWGPFDWFD